MLGGMLDRAARRSHHGKLFAFGLVLVLGGIFAGITAPGCSSDYASRVIPQAEAAPPKESSVSDTKPTPLCPSELPVDATKLAYKPPTAPQAGKCTADDISAMKDFLLTNPKSTNEDFENFVKNRGATCHDCVFADGARATWPPAPLEGIKVLTFNVGACYALVTGSQACGQSVQNAWDCGFTACLSCNSQAELESCRTKARTGVCKTFEDAAHTSCVGLDADQVCGSPFDSIRVQCVTTVRPVTDGGTDAPTDAPPGDADAAD